MKGITGIFQLVVCWGILCTAVSLNETESDTSSVSTRKLSVDDVVFHLYTRGHVDKSRIMKKDTVKDPSIDYKGSHQTKFIIHGFTGEAKDEWMINIKNSYLVVGDYNVVIVDWSKRATLYPRPNDIEWRKNVPETNGSIDFLRQMDQLNGKKRQPVARFYWASVHDVNHVGQLVAEFIDNLVQEFEADLKDIHLVGHSLGAHVSGVAGAFVKSGKVGRITGLDPASPKYVGAPKKKRLDKTDARFVDVIHTDTKGIMHLGYRDQCGHVDFYPNGGTDHPECGWWEGTISPCYHSKAHEYFLESLKDLRRFPAYKCRSLEVEIANTQFWGADSWLCRECCDRCPAPAVFMGEAASPDLTGLFYVHTMKEVKPNCITRARSAVSSAEPPSKAPFTHPELLMFTVVFSSVLCIL